MIAFDNHFENCKFHLGHLFRVRRVRTWLKKKPTHSSFDCNALFETNWNRFGMTKRRPRTKLYWSRVRFCSIKKVFDFRRFDCVRLAKRLGEFDYVRLPNPIQINRTIEVRLSLITERSIGYVGFMHPESRQADKFQQFYCSSLQVLSSLHWLLVVASLG